MAKPKFDLDAEVAALGALSREELRERWLAAFGNPAPVRASRELLFLGVRFDLYEKAGLGFSPAFKRRLKQIAADIRAGRESSDRSPRLSVGTRLIREWRDETHIVEVVEDGFAWKGKRYASLTAIAREITGMSWSGPRFFGLYDKRRQAAGITFTETGAGS